MKLLFFSWLAGLFSAVPGLAFADHGATASTQRDPWIDLAFDHLVLAGLASPSAKPVDQMTNLEMAQATAGAAQKLMDPNTPAPPEEGIRALNRLVDEFDDELAVMGVYATMVEDRIRDEERRNEEFGTLQKGLLTQTGTQLSGYARGYFDLYRGFGVNAIYAPMDNNDIMFEDFKLKSVPVPFVLFNADIRLTRTIGLYYADPVNPTYNLRWLSFSNVNDVANLTAGDFYRHYTPLTLWNNDVPLYTMIEPESYARVRKDVEELAYLDHGPDWHMRGFEATSDQAVTLVQPLDSFHLQAMAGELQSAAQYSFAQDYAGGEAALDFLDGQLEVKGTGLLLWDDSQASDVPYIPGLFTTYSKQYQVGSLSARGTCPIQEDTQLTASVEWAGSLYQDDSTQSQSVLQDSAILGNGTLHLGSAQVTVKYIHTGAYFYSPGAQTNRYTPAMGGVGYLSNNQNLDDALPGYLDNYVFQDVNRPSFAPYDRMAENILPYGDATPNREGFVLGGSAELGKEGWLKPQLSVDLGMRELQPNLALTVTGPVAVDSGTNTANARTFTGVEGALKADCNKVLDGLPSTCSIALDYKHQTTDLGLGAAPFSVDTFILSADAGPFPDIPLLEGMVLSGAYELNQGSGNEYSLNNLGTPPTLAEYPFYLDPSLIGQYTYQTLDITRTSWSFGFKLPLSQSANLHGDWFYHQYTWASEPGFDRREEIWRATYELSF